MLFRRIVLSALLVGVLGGLLLSVMQWVGITPVILAAESYEIQSERPHHDHSHGDADHHADAWEPENGFERSFYSVISNIFAAIGFSAVLLALMAQLQIQGLTHINLRRGVLWGAAGFTAFFLAPGLGLEPEIPGLEAADIQYRQTWWLCTVAGAAIGLGLIAFANNTFKALGIVFLIAPHIIGAPHPVDGSVFAHPDPQVVEILTGLHQQFIVASAVSSFVFWLVLGALSALLLNRRVLRGLNTERMDIAANDSHH